jgi:hypothetical protein
MPWAPRREAPVTTSSAARLTEEDEPETTPAEATVEDEPQDNGPPPPPPEAGDPDQQWDTPSGFVRPPDVPGAPGQPPPPPSVTTVHPPSAGPTTQRRRVGGFNLGELERRIREFTREVQKPFRRLERQVREQQAVDVARLADAGDCEGSLALADAWLRDTRRAADEESVRRGVLLQKLRCLNHLGRTAEAEAVRLELEQR